MARGGAGGRIIRVTTLAKDGPGSLKEAIDAKGPRIVVFEVGGTIDLGKHSISIKEPYLTVAGQTAPGDGVTLYNGRLRAASTCEVGDRGADRATTANHDARARAHSSYCV